MFIAVPYTSVNKNFSIFLSVTFVNPNKNMQINATFLSIKATAKFRQQISFDTLETRI